MNQNTDSKPKPLVEFNKLYSDGLSVEQIAEKIATPMNRQLEIIRGQIRLIAADQQIPMEKLQ